MLASAVQRAHQQGVWTLFTSDFPKDKQGR